MKFIRNKSKIINRVLYGLLSLKFDSYEQASDVIGLSSAKVLNHAVINGGIPEDHHIQLICDYFGIHKDIIFNQDDINKRLDLFEKDLLEPLEDDKFDYPKQGFKGGVGVKVSRFRKPIKNKIKRPVLYAVMVADNIKLSKLADMVGLSRRRIGAYIYDGENPSQRSEKAIANVLDFNSSYLFLLIEKGL